MSSKYTIGELIDMVEVSNIKKEVKEEILEVLMQYSVIERHIKLK